MKIGAAFGWIVLCIWLYGCSAAPQSSELQFFRYNESSGITSLDPIKANNLANIWVVQQLYTGLVRQENNLSIVPDLATRWTVDSSGTLWTFYLRSNVYFHKNKCFGADSTRCMRASDVAFSLNRVKDAGPAWIFKNADSTQFTEVVNDTTLQIRLRAPQSNFLVLLSMPYCGIVAPEALAFYGADFRANPVGTGPFFLKIWGENEKLVLHKNKQFYQRDSLQKQLPYLDGVVVTFVKDKQTAFLDFMQGKTHFLSGLDPSYKDELLGPSGKLKTRYQESMYLEKAPYLNTEYIGFNLSADHPFATNAHLRKALSLSLDRERLIKFLRNGWGIPGYYMVPPSLGLNQTHTNAEFDLKQAQQALQKAGYNQFKDTPQLTIYIDPNYAELFTGILRQWNEIGWNITMEVLDRPTLKSQVAKGQLSCFRGSWIADYADAENYLSLFYGPNVSPAGSNYTHFYEAGADSLYQLAMRTLNQEKRTAYLLQMQELVQSHMPVIVLFYDERARFIRKEVKNLGGNAMNHLDLRYTRLKAISGL